MPAGNRSRIPFHSKKASSLEKKSNDFLEDDSDSSDFMWQNDSAWDEPRQQKDVSSSAESFSTANQEWNGNDEWGDTSFPQRKATASKQPKWMIPAAVIVLLVAIGSILILSASGKKSAEVPAEDMVQADAVVTLSADAKEELVVNSTTARVVDTQKPTLTPAETSASAQESVPTQASAVTVPPPKTDYSSAFFLYDPSLRYFASQLTAQEKVGFEALYKGLLQQLPIISLEGEYTEAEYNRICYAICYDCPELIGVDFESGWTARYRQISGKEYYTSVEPVYVYASLAETQSVYEQLIVAIQNIPVSATDIFSTELAIYQAILSSASYSRDAEHCAYADSVFVYHQAKCSGYASAFVLACRMNGIPAVCILGTGQPKGHQADSHVWTKLCIGGKWYACDPTWDDPISTDAGIDQRTLPAPLNEIYDYFNLTDAEMNVEHTIDTVYKDYHLTLPKCTSTDASFWNHCLPAYIAGNDWEAQLTQQLNEAANGSREAVLLHFSTKSKYENALASLDSIIKEWQKISGNAGTYFYVNSEIQLYIGLYDFSFEENPFRENNLWVRYFSVGDADCAMVYCEGHYMLIDGGNPQNSRKLYSYIVNSDIQRIDVIISTHPDSDHVGGISGALSVPICEVGCLYSPVEVSDKNGFNTMLKKLEERNMSPIVPDVGDSFSLGSAKVTFLSPPKNAGFSDNDRSLVLTVQYGNRIFLFMGDAEESAENYILNHNSNIKADVIKIGHHGASTSSSETFLRTVRPYIAIISCAAGNDQHPSPEVLYRLQQAGCPNIYRTDEDGDIVLFCDGESITVMRQE